MLEALQMQKMTESTESWSIKLSLSLAILQGFPCQNVHHVLIIALTSDPLLLTWKTVAVCF